MKLWKRRELDIVWLWGAMLLATYIADILR